ncbi:MAG: hypothetical protein LBQ40_03840 [Clostridiales bacterium]|jgi:DNA repair ATPase RecN|nr:hypothetical protein [Clostridiales bacterium]
MGNQETQTLIDAFKAYRDLLTPIQSNLNDFIGLYSGVKESADTLNAAFGGNVRADVEKLYKNLLSQVERANELSSKIDKFMTLTNKYTAEINQMLTVFGKVEEKLAAVNAIESKAEEQIGRLDALLEEKTKNYNVKELQKTLDGYNRDIQKVGEFINRDVAESLSQSRIKLDVMKSDLEGIVKKQKDESADMEKIIESYAQTSDFLKKIAEKQDVNEAYIFDILDQWADSRKVKIKKRDSREI